jgi:hypothetical protein
MTVKTHGSTAYPAGMGWIAQLSLLTWAALDVGLCSATSVKRPPVSIESQLREKLRKIEALFAGGGTTGERLADRTGLQQTQGPPGSASLASTMMA